MKVETSFYNAVHWYVDTQYILCNKLPEIDLSVWDNMMWKGWENEDIFQWFITDLVRDNAEQLANLFGLKFTYSDLLDCCILCVDHWGTSWHDVVIEYDDHGGSDNNDEMCKWLRKSLIDAKSSCKEINGK